MNLFRISGFLSCWKQLEKQPRVFLVKDLQCHTNEFVFFMNALYIWNVWKALSRTWY